MGKITVSCSKLKNQQIIPLPGSKSESNRALIINALASTPGSINNLAIARDTDIMRGLLSKQSDLYNAQDAGTVMRFMTAYLAVTAKNIVLTGTERMQARPIAILVEALGKLGVRINYLKNPGFPPIEIIGMEKQITAKLEIDGEISSQYISALLMIAPVLPQGLSLIIKGKRVSQPYIDMTLSIMRHFGIQVDEYEQEYHVAPQQYSYSPFYVEADWSGASYWYSIFALSDLESMTISGLKENSYQGDSILKDLMVDFGVITEFKDGMAILSKKKQSLPANIDFIKCPDLAQTFAVLCACIGHECEFTGLQTLKIKETDRIAALKNELIKLGGDFAELEESWVVKPIPEENLSPNNHYMLSTYEDHRMAMAFASIGVRTKVTFDDGNVVNKSYPTFWKDLENFGFLVEV